MSKPRTHCINGHEWSPETTRPHTKKLASGEYKEYRECRPCHSTKTFTSNAPAKAANRAAAISLHKMDVVTDDWRQCPDCPRCHSPLSTDWEGGPECLLNQHTPRAHMQGVLI